METEYCRGRKRGQGLVEYALILALVALVVIVAAFLLGRATQRVYGVIGGAMGAKYNSVGQHALEITTAECIAVQSPPETGLWVVGLTNEDVANLTGSTNLAVGTGIGGALSPVETNGPGGFKFHPLLLETSADLGICPTSVVIQVKDGTIAVSPISKVTQP